MKMWAKRHSVPACIRQPHLTWHDCSRTRSHRSTFWRLGHAHRLQCSDCSFSSV